jgi:hypothetical protein
MRKSVFSLLLLFLIPLSSIKGQGDDTDSTFAAIDTLSPDFGLFNSDEILRISLRFDLTEYIRKKPKEEYLKAVLTYHLSEKDSINKEIKLRSRGISRNSICNFPPISLNFRKSDLKSSEMKKIDKIKMVTHCNSGYEEYLFKEYLIYKLYNVLTDYSFKVRLVKVDYISSAKNQKIIRSYAFLIEPLDILAERTESTPVESPAVSQKSIIPPMLDRMALFNYMIGNTDWSLAGQHNIKVLSVTDPDYPGLGALVPYDFDYAGLVNAHYALPTEGLGLENVRQRRFLGYCRSRGQYIESLKEFEENKGEFYKIINDFKYLNEKEKKYMIAYLDEFYKAIEKDFLIPALLRECKE